MRVDEVTGNMQVGASSASSSQGLAFNNDVHAGIAQAMSTYSFHLWSLVELLWCNSL